MIRYYKYNMDYYYVGFEDSETVLTGATTIEPLTVDHIVFNVNTQEWELETTQDLTLDELKVIYYKDVQNFFDDMMENALSGIASFEEGTFQTQETEWRAWSLDNTAPTPYVDILCYRRSTDKETLMEKIGLKVMFFADIQGQMHTLEDAISKAGTSVALELIPYPWNA